MTLDQYNQASLVVTKIRDLQRLIRNTEGNVVITIDGVNIASRYDVSDVEDDIRLLLEQDLAAYLGKLEAI